LETKEEERIGAAEWRREASEEEGKNELQAWRCQQMHMVENGIDEPHVCDFLLSPTCIIPLIRPGRQEKGFDYEE